jgi:pilus assembly protein CpaF
MSHEQTPQDLTDLTKVALFDDELDDELHVDRRDDHHDADRVAGGSLHPLAMNHGATAIGDHTAATSVIGRRRRDGTTHDMAIAAGAHFGSQRSLGEGIDWGLVRAFRQSAADQLTNALVDREGVPDDVREELGRKIVIDLVSDHAREADTVGQGGFAPAEQQRLAQAIFDSLFGLGRLQPLVDHPELENIEVRGYDNVILVYADGRIEQGPAVADSDEELIDTLAFLAARVGNTDRPFSPANPDLDLTLPATEGAIGARLAASAWNTPRPLVVIRLHRLVDVDLDDMIDRGTMDPGLAGFLRAAIRAKTSVVVSGAQGSGKTTTVRALCNEIDPLEAIGTIETEFELHLHEMGERHIRCSAWEARPGSGERDAFGRRIGEVTLDDILFRSLRMNLSRIIVGEVRGREVIPMFKAMQAGAGSISTTHAYSARAAVERLVTCATEAGPQISEAWAYRQVAEHINLIVQVQMEDVVDGDGVARRHRYVSEVIAVERGDDGRPAITDVYVPGPDGRATPGVLPQWLRGLTRYGFDDSPFRRGEATA